MLLFLFLEFYFVSEDSTMYINMHIKKIWFRFAYKLACLLLFCMINYAGCFFLMYCCIVFCPILILRYDQCRETKQWRKFQTVNIFSRYLSINFCVTLIIMIWRNVVMNAISECMTNFADSSNISWWMNCYIQHFNLANFWDQRILYSKTLIVSNYILKEKF